MTPFGKYFLLERINVGGMAEVYKAKTVGVEGFEKIVAIKRILPSVAEDDEFIKMFIDEAKISSQLSHANLAQTFDLGRTDAGEWYIAMEYVPGKDLRAIFERMKRAGTQMPLPVTVWAVSRLLDGLDYAHRKRDPAGRDLHIVHRDVSPQNIILSYEGEVKLIDFGISNAARIRAPPVAGKAVSSKAATKIAKTQAGILKGKFGYMSPEQVRGLPLDRRSDIFAAGVVLYEMCTGERLFEGSSDFSLLAKVEQALILPPSQLNANLPQKLSRIILKALAREPADRYQTAEAFADDLTRFLLETEGKPVTRDDAAAFMRASFTEQHDDEPPPPRRPPPSPGPRPPPPPLDSLEGVADRDEGVVGEDDPDRTQKGFPPGAGRSDPPAEIIVRARMQSAPPLPEPPRIPTLELPRAPPPEPRPPPKRFEDQPKPLLDRKARLRPPHPSASFDWWVKIASVCIAALAILVAVLLLWPVQKPKRAPRAAPALALSIEPPPQPEPVKQSSVLSSPAGAQVWVDGVSLGVTPLFLPALDPQTSHAVAVEKKCYRSWQLVLPPRAGRRELAATLQPSCLWTSREKTGMPAPQALPGEPASSLLGFLALTSRPAAQVLIDGVDIGQMTPLPGWPLKPGQHQLRLVAKNRSKELEVAIRGGETHSEAVELPRSSRRRNRL